MSVVLGYPHTGLSFRDVEIEDSFWLPRLETNRKITIPYCFDRCQETGRLANFAKAARRLPGKFEGVGCFNDSDVFKVVEAASYSLSTHPDENLKSFLDRVIDDIAGAQEDDGYLYTGRTIDPDKPGRGAGPQRWAWIHCGSHELYNLGHLIEAAVAHHEGTGERSLLNVAVRAFELLINTFGWDKLRDVPGHQEIELGLVRLFSAIGDGRCLHLAKYFLDQRGHGEGRSYSSPLREYQQDHLPVLEQVEAVGHCVRATYMYSGMTDIAAFFGDKEYSFAVDRLWEDVVSCKLYLTGGLGARRKGESFGKAYHLPNASAYNETCAAIGSILWNYRLFLLRGEAKYVDVLERTLYNGFLSGVGLSGEHFFYPNPLECKTTGRTRRPWFSCACCPSNVARFMPTIPGLVYATRGRSIYANVYVGSRARFNLDGDRVDIVQRTTYPWCGHIAFEVSVMESTRFALHLRLPGWACGVAVPSGLYHYASTRGGGDSPESDCSPGWHLRLVGEELRPETAFGYAVLDRVWQSGDTVELELDMPVRRVLANKHVSANSGRVAVERGPLIYCAESADHDGTCVFDFVIDEACHLRPEHDRDLLGGITMLRGRTVRVVRCDEIGGQDPESSNLAFAGADLTMVPYFVWAHRDMGSMQVWFPRTVEAAKIACVERSATVAASQGKTQSTEIGDVVADVANGTCRS
eukprot:TRINITY_DN13711_c0_g1_i1.p1 TRINITY_DN13711_c0_g1~~TRINITY_DN13711_c0_g1_i1.p1  ORF type:complete len:695 (+),score=80.97 TRINITY_DN13711_c0_g1_i1:201-2285(+)